MYTIAVVISLQNQPRVLGPNPKASFFLKAKQFGHSVFGNQQGKLNTGIIVVVLNCKYAHIGPNPTTCSMLFSSLLGLLLLHSNS